MSHLTDLIERLRNGCVNHPRRWSGDTHDDLGGSVDEPATDAVMAEAAAALEAAMRDTARLEALANGARVIQAWSNPDRLAIKLPDTLTANADGLMLDVLRAAIDARMDASND